MAGDKTISSSSFKKNNNGNGLLLYQYYPSFFSQKVVFVLHEKKLKFKSYIIDLIRGDQYETWFLKVNPKCEVPVLKDGVKLIPDSRRIIDYLEDNFSNGDTPRLIPEKGTPQYLIVQRMRDLIDSVPINAITFGCLIHPELTGEIKMPPEEVKGRVANLQSKAHVLQEYAEKYKDYQDYYLVKKASVERFRAIVEDTNEIDKAFLDAIYTLKESEKLLASQENKKGWLCGDKFTVADISLVMLLHRLKIIGLLERWFSEHDLKHLQDYFKRAQQRDAFRRTINQNSSLLKSFSSMDTKDQVLVTVGSIAVIIGAVGIATFLIGRNK